MPLEISRTLAQAQYFWEGLNNLFNTFYSRWARFSVTRFLAFDMVSTSRKIKVNNTQTLLTRVSLNSQLFENGKVSLEAVGMLQSRRGVWINEGSKSLLFIVSGVISIDTGSLLRVLSEQENVHLHANTQKTARFSAQFCYIYIVLRL